MPRKRNLATRSVTFTWRGDDERYNDAAMRAFSEMFHSQHAVLDEASPIKRRVDDLLDDCGAETVDAIMDELLRRRIQRAAYDR